VSKNTKTDACVLVSGGLDSAVLLSELSRTHWRVFPVFVRHGLKWEGVELYWLRRFMRRLASARIQPLRIIELPMADVYDNHWSFTGQGVPHARTTDAAVYLPGRNLLLLSKTAVFCALNEIPVIALGPLDHNPFPDATPTFFRQFQQAASRALNHRLRVVTPFRRLTKSQVVRRGAYLPLHLTFSCIAPRGRVHCGRCNKCAERKRAFRQARIADPTHYAA
jgi:7-cyano-7-deazaguanine synthase